MNRPYLATATPPGPWASDRRRHCAPGRVDPDVFFPDRNSQLAVIPALKTCQHCPVRQECADYALAHPGLHGVWGGLTQAERDRVHHLQRFEDDL